MTEAVYKKVGKYLDEKGHIHHYKCEDIFHTRKLELHIYYLRKNPKVLPLIKTRRMKSGYSHRNHGQYFMLQRKCRKCKNEMNCKKGKGCEIEKQFELDDFRVFKRKACSCKGKCLVKKICKKTGEVKNNA